LGPALDVILDSAVPGFGSRSFGDDPEEVAKMGRAFIRGLRDGGVASLAKHFPLGGSLKFDESSTTVPIIHETLEQLRHKVLVPFREAVKEGVPSVMACGVAISSLGPRLLHACFSRKIVTELLREQLGFEGVVVSECLEMTSIAPNVGVGQATIMGIRAGCDILTICRSLPLQVEAFASLSLALKNGGLSWDLIQRATERVMRLRAAHTSWSRALNPGALQQLAPNRLSHRTLATRVYKESMTLIRDDAGNIPLTKVLSDSSTVLILSPLLLHRASDGASTTTSCPPLPAPRETAKTVLQKGEEHFQHFGHALASYKIGQVLHTSYTSHGVREEHERLIADADAIIIFTADALRNQYQVAFAKHVAAICKLRALDNNRPKRLILASVSTPFDFPTEATWFGTQICAYDSSIIALRCLAGVLGGEVAPTGRLPRLTPAREVSIAEGTHHQTWLVEQLDLEKDQQALVRFFKETAQDNPDGRSPREDLYALLVSCYSENMRRPFDTRLPVDFQGFVIRNTSTKVIYGFASALYWPHFRRGFLGDVLVLPERRGLSMGRDLCTSVARYLTQRHRIDRVQFGSPILATTPGLPVPVDSNSPSDLGFFTSL
jgi:beta-N-acetylhexosaminidase